MLHKEKSGMMPTECCIFLDGSCCCSKFQNAVPQRTLGNGYITYTFWHKVCPMLDFKSYLFIYLFIYLLIITIIISNGVQTCNQRSS